MYGSSSQKKEEDTCIPVIRKEKDHTLFIHGMTLSGYTSSVFKLHYNKNVNEVWKGDCTFSQCLHCWSKLRLEAAAFVLARADFPTTTQLLMKLQGINRRAYYTARLFYGIS